MPYQPIEDYGIIGNLRTAALIGKNGSLDWLCYPNFDSPSIFGALLDDRIGGCFRIASASANVAHKQLYWPDTNILVTRFLDADGVGEVVDFMPMGSCAESSPNGCIVRRVRVLRGAVKFCLKCRPAFNYARDPHTTRVFKGGARFHSKGLHMVLSSPVPLHHSADNGVEAEFTLHEGNGKTFQLAETDGHGGGLDAPVPERLSDELFNQTVAYWRNWISKGTYRGRWREMVNRSALVLKLLTFQPTGAIVAAPTCSLPESPGGTRNWDYRFTWIRDAAFTVYSLMRLGHTEEALQFANFLENRCKELGARGSLQTVYGIDGRRRLKEEKLDHLDGYMGSRPVRIGNAAYRQLQLDIYGELMDSLYLYSKYGAPVSYELWTYLRRLTNWVCDNWRRKDDAIWEVRGGRRNFVYSKMMCWVAIDRALRLASKRSLPSDWQRWMRVRDRIYQDVLSRGWSADRKAFVQSYDFEALDASLLLMPLVFFISPNDPRMVSTIDAINRSPKNGGLVSDGLVYRYDVDKTPDGMKGTEGTFNICTFWLVEALTRASTDDPARLQDARLLFEQMLGYANHLGLYSEQLGVDGRALGNFPQALTHLSLISAAFNLDRYLDGAGRPRP